MIFGAIYHFFTKPTIIGLDLRYTIYIFLLPMIIGMLSLGIYRRDFLADRFKGGQSIVFLSLMSVFYLLQGLIFSYLCFGQIAGMGWDLANALTAKNNIREPLHCEPNKIWTTNRSGYISFTFHDKSETFATDDQYAKDCVGKNLKDYTIAIEARRGIWNCYLVDSWEMRKK